MLKRFELHNHTTESDAGIDCAALFRHMKADRVDVFAITDHNTVSGHRILRELQDEMASEMPRHIARWGRPSSYAKWEEYVDVIRQWMKARPAYALENLRKYFSLDQSYIDELVEKYTPKP